MKIAFIPCGNSETHTETSLSVHSELDMHFRWHSLWEIVPPSFTENYEQMRTNDQFAQSIGLVWNQIASCIVSNFLENRLDVFWCYFFFFFFFFFLLSTFLAHPVRIPRACYAQILCNTEICSISP